MTKRKHQQLRKVAEIRLQKSDWCPDCGELRMLCTCPDWREFDVQLGHIADSMAGDMEQPKPCPYCGAAPDTCNCIELLFGTEGESDD